MKPKRLLGSSREDPIRSRRDDQQGTPVAFPIIAKDGKIGVQNDPRGAIGVDPARGQFVRVGGGLAVEMGSPFRIVPVLGAGVEINGKGEIVPSLSSSVKLNARNKLIATPTTAEVSDPDGGTAQQTLARKANVADTRFPIAHGRVTLVLGVATVLDTDVVSDSTVLMSHGTLSGIQGMLSSSVSDGVGFGIHSSSGTDAGVVHYAVWNT